MVSRLPDGVRREARVLLVHGISLGAWGWEDNFLPYLAARGFAAYALSLRAHGESEGHERTRSWRLKDFAADLIQSGPMPYGVST